MTELIDLSEVAGQAGKFDCFLEQVRDRFGFDHVAYLGSNRLPAQCMAMSPILKSGSAIIPNRPIT
ncbi:hypothetical protein [Gemmobacter sp. 24YEA27]|uniref:hypothetical protein n=1 Tax=Gemmobacter sp. 24YEA27 TaxID=3040672 RepID=UPI0024B367DF|nr:hypothetical protein [Gemmobacter sp. 24YEA27]